jgi:hypothetical protein
MLSLRLPWFAHPVALGFGKSFQTVTAECVVIVVAQPFKNLSEQHEVGNIS